MGEPVGVGQFSVLHTAPHHNRRGEWKSNVQFHIPHPPGTIECLETSCILFNNGPIQHLQLPSAALLRELGADQQKVSTHAIIVIVCQVYVLCVLVGWGWWSCALVLGRWCDRRRSIRE